jgi:hypothetical protein
MEILLNQRILRNSKQREVSLRFNSCQGPGTRENLPREKGPDTQVKGKRPHQRFHFEGNFLFEG